MAEVRGRQARQFHNHAVSPWSLREARSDRQEGPAAHLGQRSWHVSKEVRRWLGSTTAGSRRAARGEDRELPSSEAESVAERHRAQVGPRQAQGRRAGRFAGSYELAERVCGVFGCPHYDHLSGGGGTMSQERFEDLNLVPPEEGFELYRYKYAEKMRTSGWSGL